MGFRRAIGSSPDLRSRRTDDLIYGLAAPTMGRWIGRFGAGRVMTAGLAIASVGLVACAFSFSKIAFVAALIAIETASNLVQYGAAFALLVQIGPQVAQLSISYLTLIAEFFSRLAVWMRWKIVYSGSKVVLSVLLFLATHRSSPQLPPAPFCLGPRR